MESEICNITFLRPEDLVQMGLYEDTGHVFRTIKMRGNVPPHLRLSKKNIRFPYDGFQKWLRQQTSGDVEEANDYGGEDDRG
ncbi:MAG: hypothetical protein KDK55_00605 [Chlamydiia bacterium]|nr:hypothetical protein [Chlamydiia bacterium]